MNDIASQPESAATASKTKSLEQQVSEWSATESDLRKDVKATDGITVKGHAEGPKKGRAAVHKAMISLAECRIGIEKRREELKRPILDLGKLVDSEARRLTAITEPREAELRADRDAYDAEEAKAKAEAERIAREAKEAEERKIREAEQAALNAKIKRIAEAGGVPDLIWITNASDAAVDELVVQLLKEKSDREELARIAEEQRKADEAKELAERKAADEADRLRREEQQKADEIARKEREKLEAEERERLEKEREEQAKRDEEERIRQADIAEKNRIEAQRLADDRKEFERQQREAREAQERIDAEKRKAAAKEKAEQDAKDEADRVAAENAKAEALRAAQAPDREKIAAWAMVVRNTIQPLPEIADADLAKWATDTRDDVLNTLTILETEIKENA